MAGLQSQAWPVRFLSPHAATESMHIWVVNTAREHGIHGRHDCVVMAACHLAPHPHLVLGPGNAAQPPPPDRHEVIPAPIGATGLHKGCHNPQPTKPQPTLHMYNTRIPHTQHSHHHTLHTHTHTAATAPQKTQAST